MTPTELLRDKLDEMGVECTFDDSDDYEIVEWQGSYNLWWQFVYDPDEEEPYGELRLLEAGGSTHLTTEQAIAATVSAGTCKRIYHPNRITKTCTCSNCGYGASDERWAYCPKCGHKYVHGEVEEMWKAAGRKVAE